MDGEAIEDIEELSVEDVARGRSGGRKVDLWSGSGEAAEVLVHSSARPRTTRAVKPPGAKQRRHVPSMDAGSEAPGKEIGSGTYFLPGRATIYVKTYGCSHNRSDSEVMAGLLSREGYDVVLDDDEGREDSDLWLINSCSVKNPSELAFVKEIERAKESGKRVVLAGCVSQHSPRDPRWNGLSVVGVQQIDRVVEVVEETLKGGSVQLVRERTEDVVESQPSDAELADHGQIEATSKSGKRKAGGAPLDLPKIRRNPLIEVVPINTGCLNSCTYCKTKFARGNLGSYEPRAILDRIEQVIGEGVVEIWLTSEDTGAYGLDIGTNIAELLESITGILDHHPHVRLRVGMTNPPYIVDHLERISAVLNHPGVFAFLHIPVQSGSDSILERMKRLYSAAEFCRVCDSLLGSVPGITIATDVICGFPGETEEDHRETVELVRRYSFPILHISQFYPRPGTPAARMVPVVPQSVKKDRTREITQVFEAFRPYEALVGHTIRAVLVTDRAHDGVKLIGHDKSYTQILVDAEGRDDEVLGRMVDVEIVGAGRWSVEGRLLGFTEGVPEPSLPALNAANIKARSLKRSSAKVVVRKNRRGSGTTGPPREHAKFVYGGLVFLVAVAYLLVRGTVISLVTSALVVWIFWRMYRTSTAST
ncbi:hypothetical protein DFJ74DRAFT_52129 [Hyaloraphidium curvatum]|nr:hypothetical protein DFJ74DRAFT_52129 [Hyaloraphidium curvatum]